MTALARVFADVRFAARVLLKTPSFTVAAVVVLALGIGLNTATFAVMHELIYKPRPFADPDRIVQLYTKDTVRPDDHRTFSYAAWQAVNARRETFAGVLAHSLTVVGVGDGSDTARAFSGVVSGNYFDVLGVQPTRGRAFTDAEATPGANVPVVIASHRFWLKRGAPRDFVGSTLRVNERPFTVVGVAPEGFTGTMAMFGPELFFPLGVFDTLSNDFQEGAQRRLAAESAHLLFLVARLAPGVTRDAASAALAATARGLEGANPAEYRDKTFTLGTLPRLSTSDGPQDEGELGALAVLMLAMTTIVLVIACLNLANMLLARGAARRKEIAIRLALGGGRRRIVAQLLTEGLLLSLAGGVGGVVLASWATTLLVASFTSVLPLAIDFGGASTPMVLAVTVGFSVFATACFALGPALSLSRPSALVELKAHAGEDAATSRRWAWVPRSPLVLAQLSLSMALLVAAGLFLRGVMAASNVTTGLVAAESTLLVELDASLGGFDETRSRQIYARVSERLAAEPGVRAASVASTVPFGLITLGRAVQRAGMPPSPGTRATTAAEGLSFNARWNSVGTDYFEAFGVPLVRGRAFTQVESTFATAPKVAIIDETLAKRLWPDGDALGQRIQFARPGAEAAGTVSGGNVSESHEVAAGGEGDTMEVIGIAAPIRARLTNREQEAAVYVPFAQGFQRSVQFHVRLAGPPTAAALDGIRRAIREAAPGLPVFKVRTFREHFESSADYWMVRMGATLFGVFGTLAIVLTMAGVYGVKAYAVARRTREIGIRIALGATPASVRLMVLREGLALAAGGISVGVLLGAGLSRVLASLLYEVSPLDPATFVIAPAVLFAAVMLACWIPARRATRVSPLTALRTE